jgi:hypothetical protein
MKLYKATLYVVAQILIGTDGKFYLKWYGTHPDQGGMSERTGQIGFSTLDDLVKGGIPLMLAHDTEETWRRKVAEKKD